MAVKCPIFGRLGTKGLMAECSNRQLMKLPWIVIDENINFSSSSLPVVLNWAEITLLRFTAYVGHWVIDFIRVDKGIHSILHEYISFTFFCLTVNQLRNFLCAMHWWEKSATRNKCFHWASVSLTRWANFWTSFWTNRKVVLVLVEIFQAGIVSALNTWKNRATEKKFEGGICSGDAANAWTIKGAIQQNNIGCTYFPP